MIRETYLDVVAALEAVGYQRAPGSGYAGGGKWPTIICHGGDSKDKLSIWPTPDGWRARCFTGEARGCHGRQLHDSIRRAAGLYRPDRAAAPRATPAPRTVHVLDRGRLATARGLWADTLEIPAHPAHPARHWLAHRNLWRPDLDLPPSVRWLPARDGPSAGAVVAALAPPGAGRVSGVHLVHVDADGAPALDRPGGLTKRSHGHLAGAICVIGLLDDSGPVHVAEGLADALAIAARDVWPAVAMVGVAAHRHEDLTRWLAARDHVHVWPDQGAEGQAAAQLLARRVVGFGGSASLERVGGSAADPAAAAGPFAPVDVDARLAYVHGLVRDGLPLWEAQRVADASMVPQETDTSVGSTQGTLRVQLGRTH